MYEHVRMSTPFLCLTIKLCMVYVDNLDSTNLDAAQVPTKCMEMICFTQKQRLRRQQYVATF